MGSACYLDKTTSEWRHITSFFFDYEFHVWLVSIQYSVYLIDYSVFGGPGNKTGARVQKSVVQTTRETVTERRLQINSFSEWYSQSSRKRPARKFEKVVVTRAGRLREGALVSD